MPSASSLDEVNAATASAERSSSYAERRLLCTLHPTLESVGSYAPGGETCEKDAGSATLKTRLCRLQFKNLSCKKDAGSVYAQDSALPLTVQEPGV